MNDAAKTKSYTRAEALQEVFLQYANKYADSSSAPLVSALLDEAVREKHGSGYVEGDFACLTRAFKAEELLKLLPQAQEVEKNSPKELPETRYNLWRSLVCGMVEGNSDTPHFAQVLLKKAALSKNEQKRLRDALKDVFEHISFLEVRQSLFWALRKVTQKSEDIVVRAILQAVARLADPADLVRLFSR